MASTEIVVRGGPRPVEYLGEFLKFVRARTGFRFENFTTPRHLQTTLDQLAFNRIPMRVWETIMTTALRIASMSSSIEHRVREFGAFFIDVLVWIVKRLVRMGLLKFALFLLGLALDPVVTAVTTGIFMLVDFFADVLWQKLSEFIQSKLITAPYYNHFVGL